MNESATPALSEEIKALLVETLMLPQAPGQLVDDQPLFGPGGLGLDSVDALQIVVALDKAYGLKIKDVGEAQAILKSVATIASAVHRHRSV
ncbi:MAG: phosphopantetheine-binding protein [Verrucomicrobiota bacterium]|jgi:acyl carrier protein